MRLSLMSCWDSTLPLLLAEVPGMVMLMRYRSPCAGDQLTKKTAGRARMFRYVPAWVSAITQCVVSVLYASSPSARASMNTVLAQFHQPLLSRLSTSLQGAVYQHVMQGAIYKPGCRLSTRIIHILHDFLTNYVWIKQLLQMYEHTS